MRRPRVTIVDDDVFLVNMLRDFFSLRGYEVLSFGDAPSLCPLYGIGSDACSAATPCSDVLITDFQLPGVNGVELLQHLLRKQCKIGVDNMSLISGYIDERNRAAAVSMGCTFFPKPFAVISLIEWLMSREKHLDLARPLTTRRREDRYESYREITLRTKPDGAQVKGIVINVSNSGLCMKVNAPLERFGTVDIDHDPFSSCNRASVRWVKPMGNGVYLAGLHCD
ncbi:MAG: response regulator [Nitrospiraceae bacterium]|nr:response regulator [Nitrospiraceae bacterium]